MEDLVRLMAEGGRERQCIHFLVQYLGYSVCQLGTSLHLWGWGVGVGSWPVHAACALSVPCAEGILHSILGVYLCRVCVCVRVCVRVCVCMCTCVCVCMCVYV